MRRNRRIGTAAYLVFDFIAAMVSWGLLYTFRKLYIEEARYDHFIELYDLNFILGIIFIPMAWVMLYGIFGTYSDIYRKSRLVEFGLTFLQTIIGSIFIFFIFLLDDWVDTYRDYYESLFFLFSTHFLLTFLFRFIQLTITKRHIERGVVGYRTLIIGGNENAVNLYKEINEKPYSLGYHFVGYVNTNGDSNSNELKSYLPEIGHLDQLNKIIKDYHVDEVIICVETSEHPKLRRIINVLADVEVVIKIIPDMYDILSGSVKMRDVRGVVLIEIYPELMPSWQRFIKRSLDILVSGLALLIISPLLAFAALRVKMSSPGPILFRQERIGKRGRPFKIMKFRSMYVDAEKDGPQLSSEKDDRITPWGRIMRKWRLDELPQFFNILKGEMSLVGPRPERQYFIDQIMTKAPAYKHLHKVKPGLTSLGMVKFGYAENVAEMIERMKYDLLYIENMSLALDFKIMIYTILTIVQGKGK